MASRTPSYIYQSPHGIWYFQVWIPAGFREKCGQKKLIRKSLRTRSRKHALRLARGLWVKVEQEQYEDRIDQEADEDERMYFRGKSIAAQLTEDGVDTNNPYEVSRLIEELPDYDIKALALYENTLANLKEKESESTPVPVVPTRPPVSNVPSLPVTPQEPSTGITPSTLRLSDVVEKWIHFNAKVRTKKPWSKGSVKKYRPDVMMMVNMVGNPLVHELTDEMLRDLYEERLPSMPKSVGVKAIYHTGGEPVVGDDGKPMFYANGKPKTTPIWKPIDEILEIAKKTNSARYQQGTIARSALNVITFLKWAERKKYVKPGLHVVLEDLADSADLKEEKGTYFTDGDLRLLFENDSYQEGLLRNRPYRHWIPLLLIYTAGRLGEVSQLRVQDVEKKDGIWVMHIHSYDELSTVKGKVSNRTVPLHKELEKLGFRTFVEQMKAKGETNLFPVLSPLQDDNHWGRAATRWFNGESVNGEWKKGYMEQCGIAKVDANGKKNLHSFRYTWITHAKWRNIGEDMARELTGHSLGKKKDVHMNYEGEYPLADRKKAMNKIAYDFDVGSIMKWC